MKKAMVCLVLLGAFIGGIWPGSRWAISFAEWSGLDGNAAVGVWLGTNLALGMSGSVAGLFLGRPLHQRRLQPDQSLAVVSLGVLAGIGGILLTLWEASTASPWP